MEVYQSFSKCDFYKIKNMARKSLMTFICSGNTMGNLLIEHEYNSYLFYVSFAIIPIDYILQIR